MIQSVPTPKLVIVEGGEVTVEGDEVYTRVGENLPPENSEGWTRELH